MEDKGQLLLMLYDGAIDFLARAGEALESGDYEEANRFIIRAQSIITELKSALNMQYEVAESLAKLYDYFHRRLLEVNEKREKAPLIEVLGYLRELREAWATAVVTSGTRAVSFGAAAAGI
ncbi:flagellar export chaperone FliS [Thermodesulfitimonas sp.]